MEELKIGEQVVMIGLLASIMHEDCNYVPECEISDQGKYEEVVRRNQRWFSDFSFHNKESPSHVRRANHYLEEYTS